MSSTVSTSTRDEVVPIVADGTKYIPTFTVSLTSGVDVILPSGSTFPMDAVPTTEIMVVVTKASGQPVPVLCQTTWGELKSSIEDLETRTEDALVCILSSCTHSTSTITPAEAHKGLKTFSDYLSDLVIILVIMRQLKGTKLAILDGKNKGLFVGSSSSSVCTSVLLL